DGETSVRPGVSTDPQVTGPIDSWVFHRQREVGQDEEHPIRREVLRLVQALGAHPPTLGILPCQNVCGPPFLRNEFLRVLDLRIVFRLSNELSQRQVLDGRLVVLKQPIQDSFRSQWRTRSHHPFGGFYVSGASWNVQSGRDESLGHTAWNASSS